MALPRVFLAFLLVVVAACRRDPLILDDAQKVAYTVRPAVVRISAYATARFRYRTVALARVEARMHAAGYDLPAGSIPLKESTVETGAGGSGTGFLVHPDGLILTSGHVIAPTGNEKALETELRYNGAIAALVRHFPVEALRAVHREADLDQYVALMSSGAVLEAVQVVNQVELSNGETLPFQVVRYSPAMSQRGSDLALLRIARQGLPSIALGDSEAVRVGDSIWSVGYPAVASSTDEVIGGWLSRDSDLEPTFNPGTITAIKRNVANLPVFQSNVAIYRGNSGGPAVNRAGEVIGISTWGHTDAEQIKFLVPIHVARKFLDESGQRVSIEGEFNRHYRAALNAAGRGRWVEAKERLAPAMRLFRGSPDLVRFQRDAERAIGAMPAWRRRPFAATVTAVLVLAGVGVGTWATSRARERRIPPDLLRAETLESVVAPLLGAPAGQLRLGRFTFLNGSRAGEKLGLGGSGIRIGRESTICEIVLENPKVSRLHAEVVSIDGKVLLIDRNSSNGTFVNDQKIDRRFLQDGDIIYFGGRNAVAVAFHA